MNKDVEHDCAKLIFTEARYLDQRKWDEWLELYTQDAVYWVPAWETELEYVSDPRRQISLIYYPDKNGLDDRVFRIKTGMSSASTPMPRTCHVVSNITVEPLNDSDTEVMVYANWQTSSFRNKLENTFTGYYEHKLRRDESGGWKIAGKKIIVLNEVIEDSMDIYSI